MVRVLGWARLLAPVKAMETMITGCFWRLKFLGEG